MKTNILYHIQLGQICLYPTFKEWKQTIRRVPGVIYFPVYILPLRNENKKKWYHVVPPFRVYILPLRNENKIEAKSQCLQQYSLYPTFKEWKQGKTKRCTVCW